VLAPDAPRLADFGDAQIVGDEVLVLAQESKLGGKMPGSLLGGGVGGRVGGLLHGGWHGGCWLVGSGGGDFADALADAAANEFAAVGIEDLDGAVDAFDIRFRDPKADENGAFLVDRATGLLFRGDGWLGHKFRGASRCLSQFIPVCKKYFEVVEKKVLNSQHARKESPRTSVHRFARGR
jgi:hypothetical protein